MEIISSNGNYFESIEHLVIFPVLFLICHAIKHSSLINVRHNVDVVNFILKMQQTSAYITIMQSYSIICL
jgi:hypothetical protein